MELLTKLFSRKDPTTGIPSVSFSLLVYSFIGVLLAAALEMSGVISTTSIVSEIYYANAALYFGRRFSGGKSNVALDKEQ